LVLSINRKLHRPTFGWTEFAGLDIGGQRMTIYEGIFYLRSYGKLRWPYTSQILLIKYNNEPIQI